MTEVVHSLSLVQKFHGIIKNKIFHASFIFAWDIMYTEDNIVWKLLPEKEKLAT